MTSASLMLTLAGTLLSSDTFELGIGTRQDHVNWSLAGPNSLPSVMSKLVWHEIQSVELQGKVETTLCNCYFLRLEGDYGWICNGWNTDSDYAVDDQTFQDVLFLKSKAHSGKGGVWDLSLAISTYSFELNDCFFIRPLLGYSVHSQRLRMYDGKILVDLFEPGIEGMRFPELDSHYTTYWSGPWVGFDLAYEGCPCWTFSTTQEIHALYYDAKGNWNLRDDILDDFHHFGWGWGYFTKFSANYDLGCGWDIGAEFKYNYCRMNDGRDHSHVLVEQTDAPDQEIHAVSRIKQAAWHSLSCLMTLGCNF